MLPRSLNRLLASWVFTLACTSNSGDTTSTAAAGGQFGAGAALGAGGVAMGGAAPTGGVPSTGGIGSGGVSVSTSGGALNVGGGGMTSGGGMSPGGTFNTGGAPEIGGSPNSGGRVAADGGNGGAGTGGDVNTGGAVGTGGTPGDTFDPCPQNEACKVLPLGDSITDGIGFSGGYRVSLFERAITDGKSMTFVGSRMNGPQTVAGQNFPRNHEGYSGYTIGQIDDLVPGILSPDPHIVLLHIGTNDMYRSPQAAPESLGELIDHIIADLPDSLLVVSTIIPFPGGASAVSTYNDAVPGVVEERANAGAHILLVDQFTGFPTSELGDGVHPNQAGYARMAGVWYAAIETYLH